MKPKKTKAQIIDAHENRFVLTFISGIFQIAGIALAIILADDSDHSKSSITICVCFVVSLILIAFAVRCPICNRMKSPEYFDTNIFRMKTGFFRCNRCNLSNKQIRKYVDLLKRGVDIDKNVIAEFNKRDL